MLLCREDLNGFQRVGCASGFCLGEQQRMLLALKAGKWKRACELEISNSCEETLITFSRGDSSHLDKKYSCCALDCTEELFNLERSLKFKTYPSQPVMHVST